MWRGHTRHRAANPVVVSVSQAPWRHLTAWLVAAYLTVQSIEFYSTLAWLAPSYTARGWDPTHAGYLLSVRSRRPSWSPGCSPPP